MKALSTAMRILCLAALFIITSCHKAGMGGDVKVSVLVTHHGTLIPGATVYIKYNEKEFPGSDAGSYNTSVVCGVSGHGRGHAHLKGLKHGYYYFYSTGYDSAISQKVTGGVPLHIKRNERKKEIDLTIPVTE